MRILIVSEVFAPAVSGVAVTTARLAAGLAARGHSVRVLTAFQARESLRREHGDGYEVVRIPSVANPFRKGFRLTVGAGFLVRAAVAEFAPEIIHIQDPISLSLHAAAEGRRRGIPVIATHHFLPEYLSAYLPAGIRRLASVLLTARLKKLYGACVCLTVPTQTVKDALAGRGLPVPAVVSNGVDIDRFFPGEKKAGPPVILYVGRLDPEKNISLLLAACAGVTVPYELRMIGGGNLAASLREEAKRLGVKVVWVRPLDAEGKDLAEEYRRASVFCIASAHETESMVTLEAMASGLPILAADGGALPELVAEGKNGHLLPPESAEPWTAAIQSIIGDPVRMSRMGAESRKKSAERAVGLSLDAFEEIYTRQAAS